jgi:hypothetical protein
LTAAWGEVEETDHNRQYASALTEIAVEIRDETSRLSRVAA